MRRDLLKKIDLDNLGDNKEDKIEDIYINKYHKQEEDCTI
jgi:hypothetical protein